MKALQDGNSDTLHQYAMHVAKQRGVGFDPSSDIDFEGFVEWATERFASESTAAEDSEL